MVTMGWFNVTMGWCYGDCVIVARGVEGGGWPLPAQPGGYGGVL